MIGRMIATWEAANVKELARKVMTEIENILSNALNRKEGWSGTFTTTDGKRITVVNGQITKAE